MIKEELHKELRERFSPEGSMLRQHQLRLLDMLHYIDKICKNNKINYWLSSGSVLGAVRHGGFIPWDDDLDIEMLREDYDKFIEVLNAEQESPYVLQTHDTDSNYFAPYGKLRDLKSIIKECNTYDLYYKYKGVYIDIFIMEPSSSLFLNKLASVIQYRFLYQVNDKLHGKNIRRIYFPIVYGIIYKFIFPILKLLSSIGTADCLRHTLGSCFPKARFKSDIFPLTVLTFENKAFPVPGKYEKYLRRIFGEYMLLPNIDEIKYHTKEILLN